MLQLTYRGLHDNSRRLDAGGIELRTRDSLHCVTEEDALVYYAGSTDDDRGSGFVDYYPRNRYPGHHLTERRFTISCCIHPSIHHPRSFHAERIAKKVSTHDPHSILQTVLIHPTDCYFLSCIFTRSDRLKYLELELQSLGRWIFNF